MTEKQTVCIAGKNNIACNTLDYLICNYGERYNFVACCNRTETGVDGWQNSYRAHARKLGVSELKLEEIYSINNLIFISTEFDRLVKPDLFVNALLYNVHFSLLPAYRGMYTSALPILYGEKISGVTLHEIDEGIDTGKIIAQISFELDEKMTSRDLYLRYIDEGTMIIINNMEKILSGDYVAFEQPIQGASYFSKDKINYANIVIDLNCTAYQIQNQLRAFSFREFQLPQVLGKKVISWEILKCRSNKKPGTIICNGSASAVISTIDFDVRVDFISKSKNE